MSKEFDLKDMIFKLYNGMLEDMTKEWRQVKDKRIKDLIEEIKYWKKNNRLAQKDILRLKEAYTRAIERNNEHIDSMNRERHERNMLTMQLEGKVLALEKRIRELEEKGE